MAGALRLAVTDPRVEAVGLFAGNCVPLGMFDETRRLTTPVHMLLQWGDEMLWP